MKPLRPSDLQARLAAGESLQLVDVREHPEWNLARIEGALHIPLADLPRRQTELNPDAPVVCICHHGMRSAHAAAFLAQCGFEDIWNLTGGVDAWAREVDPGMARY
ncbi:MAG: rhodanese-like domain-containing protein [Planctomycetota bacterium]